MMSLSARNRIISACLMTSATMAVAADPAATSNGVPSNGIGPATTSPAAKPITFTLSGNANYSFDTDLHDGNGSFSVFRSGSSVTMDTPIDADNDFRLVVDGEYSHYFFRNLAAVPGADGSDSLDAYQFDIRPTFSHAFNPNLSAFGGLTVTASGMAEADFGESLSYGAFAGFTYQVSPKVWIGAGLSVVTQLEDNAFVVPLLTMNWQITPDLTLSSEGLGLKATYKLDDAWAIYVRGRYEWRQFRLDSGEVLSKGVLTDQAVPISVGVTYDLGDSLEFSAEAGVVAYRRLEFSESDGHVFGADEADPAGFLSVQVKYSF